MSGEAFAGPKPTDLIDVKAAEGRIIFGPVEDIERSDNVLLRARAEEDAPQVHIDREHHRAEQIAPGFVW